MNFVGMGVGSVALLAVSAVSGERWTLPRERTTILAFVYLVAASVVMFVLVLIVVRRWTASASAYIFVLMPVATSTVVGGVVVLAGVYIGALSRNRTAD